MQSRLTAQRLLRILETSSCLFVLHFYLSVSSRRERKEFRQLKLCRTLAMANLFIRDITRSPADFKTQQIFPIRLCLRTSTQLGIMQKNCKPVKVQNSKC